MYTRKERKHSDCANRSITKQTDTQRDRSRTGVALGTKTSHWQHMRHFRGPLAVGSTCTDGLVIIGLQLAEKI